MNDTLENSAPKRGKRSIQQQAENARMQMKRMDEEERQRKQAHREERERLKGELAEVESRARYFQRQEEDRERKHAHHLLGELALCDMRASGKLSAVITDAAFGALDEEHQQKIQRVLGRERVKAEAHAKKSKDAKSNGSLPPDIAI